MGKYITFVDEVTNLEYKFYIGSCPSANIAEYTLRKSDATSWQDLINLIYDNLGIEFTLAGCVISNNQSYARPTATADLLYYDTYRGHIKSLLTNCKYPYDGIYTTYTGDWCDNFSFFPANHFLYLKGSDPSTRRYIKFFNSGTVQCTVYDNNKVAQSGYSMFIGCRLSGWSDAFSKILIPDLEAFKNAATYNAARSLAKVCTIRKDYTWDGPGEVAAIYGIDTYNYSSAGNMTDALWYLLQSGGDIDDRNEDPYNKDEDGYDTSKGGGGDGSGNPYDPGDGVPEPDLPTVGITGHKLATLYIPSAQVIGQLAAYLWNSNFFTTLVKEMYADPMDVIISLGVVPFNVTPAGSKHIVVGERDTEISSAYPASEFIAIDCGSIQIKKIIGSYLDYAPYTKINLFLPYVGMVSLNTDIYMGKTMSVKYHVNIVVGEFTAFVMADGKVFNQYSGNLKVDIPLSAANYGQMWNSLINATVGLATAGVASSAASGAAASGASEGAAMEAAAAGDKAMEGIGKSAGGIINAAATKPEFTFTNSMSVGAGYMGILTPYVVIERPNVCLPMNQSKYMGYPSYITKSLGSLKGYTRVAQINLSVPGATSSERAEIERYLKNGVLIGSGSTPSGAGVILCNNSSPNNQIGKTISSVSSLNGTFRDNVDIINPTFTIERSSPTGFNYVVIPDFGRCYYVEEVNIIRKGILEVKCKCDVLQSFKSQILSNNAIIDKQENEGVFNLYINDDSLKVYQDPLISTYVFQNGFSGTNVEYVLVVAGG